MESQSVDVQHRSRVVQSQEIQRARRERRQRTSAQRAREGSGRRNPGRGLPVSGPGVRNQSPDCDQRRKRGSCHHPPAENRQGAGQYVNADQAAAENQADRRRPAGTAKVA